MPAISITKDCMSLSVMRLMCPFRTCNYDQTNACTNGCTKIFRVLGKVLVHPEWPVHAGIFSHHPQRLVSQCPLWIEMAPPDWNEAWRNSRESAPVVNQSLVTDSMIQQPGFKFPHQTWCAPNHFHPSHGLCAANLHKWGLASSDKCGSGMVQTMGDFKLPLKPKF